jgi:hypothetical protein
LITLISKEKHVSIGCYAKTVLVSSMIAQTARQDQAFCKFKENKLE